MQNAMSRRHTQHFDELTQGSHSLWRITFPDHARNFSLTKLTCNSYFSLHFSRLLLPYTDSLCYHYHILNHWEWKAKKHEENNKLSALTLTSSYFPWNVDKNRHFRLQATKIPRLSLTKLIPRLSLTFQVSGNPKRYLEDRELNQARSKPDPTRTACTWTRIDENYWHM